MGNTTSSHPVSSKYLETLSDTTYNISAGSMLGHRETMEDYYTIKLKLKDNISFFAIYDGHGGAHVAKYVSEVLYIKLQNLKNLFDREAIIKIFYEIDDEINKNIPDTKLCGSTCIFALVQPTSKFFVSTYKVLIGNLGDSFALVIDEFSNIKHTTTDHHPINLKERLRILYAGGTTYLGRVDGELAVSRAFGDFKYKTNKDLLADKQKVIAKPTITEFELDKRDLLFLSCDGVLEKTSREKIAEFIFEQQASRISQTDIIKNLFDHCLFENKSGDNMTSILISFGKSNIKNKTEYVLGRYDIYSESKYFRHKFINDAEKHGLTREELSEKNIVLNRTWRDYFI